MSDQIESRQNDIYDRLNAKSSINAENQKFATMLEQLNIRKAELNSHLIKDKSDEAEQNIKINDISARLETAQKNALDIAERIAANNNEVTAIKNENADLNAQHDKIVQNYHREKSRLESLVNITERYDGYGNSIRKIMELKDSNPGILGVIADIVKVERKYETAIETALGGTIQNIVTDKESTAKELIAYLKQNKLGRATFLPLNAISGRNTLEKEPCIKENGVIGIASNLVRVSFEYENLAKYLLGRILVVDNIDNALLIAKKYKYSLRIVTLEGEQLNPGGSMTGGAFKNSSNLLGRRREIEELKKSVSELSKSSTELKTKIADNRAKIASIRELIDADNKANREVSLAVNTEQMNLNQAKQKLSEIKIIYDKDKAEKMLLKLSEAGVRIIVNGDGIPDNPQTKIKEFMGVECQDIYFQNGYPVLYTKEGEMDTSLFDVDKRNWKTVYLNGLDNTMGYLYDTGVKIDFAGNVENDNIVFLGINLTYHYFLTRDESVGKFLGSLMDDSLAELPDRALVPLDIAQAGDQIIICLLYTSDAADE
mgnify:CR=1 FL=1